MLRAMSFEGAKAFVARWAATSASERANSQPFLCKLGGSQTRPDPGNGLRVRILRNGSLSTALATVKEPVTVLEMAKRFARANAVVDGEILETLCAIGKARHGKADGS